LNSTHTGYQCCDNTEGVGKNSCGKLGFCIQLAKSDHLGGGKQKYAFEIMELAKEISEK